MNDKTLRELMRLAVEKSHHTEDEVRAAIAAPDWDHPERMYNWRNHVPDYIQEIWPDLSLDGQLSLFILAYELAWGEEGWDRPF